MSAPIAVVLYCGLVPLLVVGVSWLVIRRDYGHPDEADEAQ